MGAEPELPGATTTDTLVPLRVEPAIVGAPGGCCPFIAGDPLTTGLRAISEEKVREIRAACGAS